MWAAIALLLISAVVENAEGADAQATVTLYSAATVDSDNKTSYGTLTLVQNGDTLTITGTLNGSNFLDGLHGFHIHETSNISNQCNAALGHFNPFNATHGAPNDTVSKRHVGDLGNVQSTNNTITINISDKLASLTNATTNVMGRAVVLHALPDDLGRGGNETSLTTGNAGARIACGIIMKASTSASTLLPLVATFIILLTFKN